MDMGFNKLDDMIDRMPERGIPGCALIVTKDGKRVYARCAGRANEETEESITENTLWWIYSASKISTCTAALQLIERGMLRLEDPVSKYLPAFRELFVKTPEGIKPARNEMKIIHLFTMTGGLDYDTTGAVDETVRCGGDTVEVALAMARKVLCFEPGTHYRYSLCHDVLGAVVSAVSSMPLGTYLAGNVWQPVGMQDTGFHPSPEQEKRFADMFAFDFSEGKAIPLGRKIRPAGTETYESGGGGVFSSASDYAKLMTALSLGGISPDGHRILKEDTVRMMEVNLLDASVRKDLWQGRLFGYGWGLCGRVHMNGTYSGSHSSEGEFGWDGAAGAYALADRKKGVAMYFGMHVQECIFAYNQLHPQMRDLVYEALEL